MNFISLLVGSSSVATEARPLNSSFALYNSMTYDVAQISKFDPHSGLFIERLAVSVREQVVG